MMKRLTNLAKKISQKIYTWWRWFNRITKRDGNPMTDDMPPYTHCLNCNTELTGMYCHKCGQYASPALPKTLDFIKEYIKNVLVVERQALPTLSNLIFHPGHMIKEYCAGRRTSYYHPMKLSFFILIILIALFSFIGTDNKIKESFAEVTSKEIFISNIVLSTIEQDEDYFKEVSASSRDTVKLIASYYIIERYDDVVGIVDVISKTEYEEPDTLIASVPSILIKDEVLVDREDGYYFSTQNEKMDEALMLNNMAEGWAMLVSILISHFPLLMFLSAPFLVMSVRLIFLRQKKYTRTYHYIFSFYYIAFVELFITVLYVIGVVCEYKFVSAQDLLMVVLFVYLTCALKYAYDIKSWFRSALSALVVNTTYTLSCLFIVMVLSMFIMVAVLL